MNAYQQSFPFSSEFSRFEDWNGNFIIWFGEQNIPYNNDERWKETAKVIASTSFFEVYPIPFPDTFERWQDWADEVAMIINGTSVQNGVPNQVFWINNYGAFVDWINNSSAVVPWVKS